MRLTSTLCFLSGPTTPKPELRQASPSGTVLGQGGIRLVALAARRHLPQQPQRQSILGVIVQDRTQYANVSHFQSFFGLLGINPSG